MGLFYRDFYNGNFFPRFYKTGQPTIKLNRIIPYLNSCSLTRDEPINSIDPVASITVAMPLLFMHLFDIYVGDNFLGSFQKFFSRTTTYILFYSNCFLSHDIATGNWIKYFCSSLVFHFWNSPKDVNFKCSYTKSINCGIFGSVYLWGFLY